MRSEIGLLFTGRGGYVEVPDFVEVGDSLSVGTRGAVANWRVSRILDLSIPPPKRWALLERVVDDEALE